MNRSELIQIMALVSTYWPHWNVPTNPDEAAMVVDAWERLLSDLDAATVAAAVDSLATEGERFAPGPGVVRSKAVGITYGAPAPTEDEAWREVKEQIRRVGSLVRYEKVDRTAEWSHPDIERVVAALGWQELCESENEVADRAHFVTLYRDRVRASTNRAAVPSSVTAIRDLAASKRLELGETA